MLTLPIRIYGDAVLRKKAKPIKQIDGQLQRFIAQMTETMLEADAPPGVGLAAPQVGRLVRVIIAREDVGDDRPVHCIINPRLAEYEEEQTDSEGCLSFPTLRGVVRRPLRILVEGIGPDEQELFLEAEGLLARVLVHEIDHLNGVMFIDKAEPDSLEWMIPDENEDAGYRLKPTALDKVQQVFDRLRQKRQ